MTDIPRTIHDIPQRQHNEDRRRRADSWLERSEDAKDDTERFIFLWIAFNAAYGRTLPSDSNQQPTEYNKFSQFLQEILDLDDKRVLEETLRRTDSDIRVILRNHYIFHPFWEAVRGSTAGRNWKANFSALNRQSFSTLDRRSMEKRAAHHVLFVLFMRLNTLRNQIVHGGATYANDSWGQDQVRDGSRIMASLVPSILEIMRADIENNPESDVWGPVMYPRINYGPQ